MMEQVTPLGAVARGMAAGAIGSKLMDYGMGAASKLAPPPSEFQPPEQIQNEETPTQTVARRLVEDMAKRGPLSPEAKKRAGTAVHYGFGSGWAVLYALAAETIPGLRSPMGGVLLGTTVWAIGDNGIVPAFRVGPPPTKVPAKGHFYYWLGHVAYGLTVWGAYELMRRPKTAALSLGALTAVARGRRKKRTGMEARMERLGSGVRSGLDRVRARRAGRARTGMHLLS